LTLRGAETRPDGRDDARDAVAALNQRLRQPSTLALPGAGQRLERGLQRLCHAALQRGRLMGRLLEQPGPAKQLGDRQRPGLRHAAPHGVLQQPQPLEHLVADPDLARTALGQRALQRTIHLAAAQRGADAPAAVGLQRPQLLRQTHGDFQEPMVDTAQFPDEPERLGQRLGAGETRHAAGHGDRPLPSRSIKLRSGPTGADQVLRV